MQQFIVWMYISDVSPAQHKGFIEITGELMTDKCDLNIWLHSFDVHSEMNEWTDAVTFF